MKPVRVLYVSGGPLDRGGISSWMLGYAARFDRERVAVDFLVHSFEEGPREREAADMGANVYRVPFRRENPALERKMMSEAISSGYDVVHAHMDGRNADALLLAKEAKVPIRISHCHNTDYVTNDPIRRVMHACLKRRIPGVATHLFACSEPAGRFLYGDRLFDAGRVSIIKNAIEPASFQFDAAMREEYRARLGLEDAFVIGHVGRFDLHQKNQLFLLDAFQKTLRMRPEAVLVLVGDGADRSAIEARVAALGIGERVRVLGYRSDVGALMNAFDLFVLPSQFEGFGIVLVEAQACGLPCIASSSVPRETNVVDCGYLPLDVDAWACEMAASQAETVRTVERSRFVQAGYDVEMEAEKLVRFYEEAAK